MTTRHSGSDSDSDYGSKSKKKKKAKTSEIRVSSRGGRIPNYVDDVQDFEQFDEDLPEGTYVEAVSEPHDEIEAVLGHCRDEGHEDDPEDDWTRNIVRMLVASSIDHDRLTAGTRMQRFHIKWKNFSHLHNTDEVYEFLKRYKGIKRVDNYIKAYKTYQERLTSPDTSREDKEGLLLAKEREKEELETYKTVDRIVAQRETGAGGVEYFCKWTNLNYDHCTWEPLEEIRPIAKDQLEAFRKREAEAKFPYKSHNYPRHARPAFQKIKEDPEYLKVTGGELKDFQLTGLNWLAYLWSKGENGILADEMGLGKVRIRVILA